jgi:hypothetical protein
VLTNMSGTYNAPDGVTLVTPLGHVLRAVAGFRGRHRIALCWAS